MKVSFVIPTFNQARFLRRCLDSCLAQRIPDAEPIVVDGGSKDETRDVLRSYGEAVRWVSEPDRGQADAVNKGVAMATGDLLAWINSDDAYADSGVLRAVLDAFAADPEVDIVCGDGLMVDERGATIRPYPARPCRTAREILLRPSSPFLQPAVFLRRDLFLAAGGLDLDLHLTLDYDLWIRLFPRARKVTFLRRTLALATYHAEAKSIRGMREQIAEAGRLKRRYARHLGLGPVDRIRLSTGMLRLRAYGLAVRVGLRRAT